MIDDFVRRKMGLFRQKNKSAAYPGFDFSVPKFVRHKWPKVTETLAEEQQALADDFMKLWHEVLPAKFNAIEKFNHRYPLKVLPSKDHFWTLEIGAGIGGHLNFERLENQHYYCVEYRANMASAIKAKFPSVKTLIGDCQKELPFEKESFDRVIAIHVLEHLPDLPNCIKEMSRLLKTGGILSVVIPCDPGLLYEFARKISAERLFKSRYKMPYRWFVRREHINCPKEIKRQISSSFEIVDEAYFPFLVPIENFNLCLGITAVKK